MDIFVLTNTVKSLIFISLYIFQILLVSWQI